MFLKRKSDRIETSQTEERDRRKKSKFNAEKEKVAKNFRIGGEFHKEDREDSFDAAESDAHYPPMVEDEIYYDMLAVRSNAEAKEIEREFHRASRSCHPNKCTVSTK